MFLKMVEKGRGGIVKLIERGWIEREGELTSKAEILLLLSTSISL